MSGVVKGKLQSHKQANVAIALGGAESEEHRLPEHTREARRILLLRSQHSFFQKHLVLKNIGSVNVRRNRLLLCDKSPTPLGHRMGWIQVNK